MRLGKEHHRKRYMFTLDMIKPLVLECRCDRTLLI